MHAFPRIRRWVSVVLLTVLLPACGSWQVEKLSPQEVIAKRQPEEVRVVVVEGVSGRGRETRYRLLSPWATADSIGGTRCGMGEEECIPNYRTSVASLSRLEVNRFDVGETFWLVAILGGITALIASADFDNVIRLQ